MTKTGTIFRVLFYAAISAALLLLSFAQLGILIKEYKGQRDIQHETIYDTIPCYYPVPRDSVVIRYVKVMVPIANDETNDELLAKGDEQQQVEPAPIDSIAVEIPITQKIYSDSLYKAYVSGFNPSLDSIFVYRKDYYREVTKKSYPKWSIGVQIGYGMHASANVGPQFAPYIGIGLNYNMLTF